MSSEVQLVGTSVHDVTSIGYVRHLLDLVLFIGTEHLVCELVCSIILPFKLFFYYLDISINLIRNLRSTPNLKSPCTIKGMIAGLSSRTGYCLFLDFFLFFRFYFILKLCYCSN